jgi:hypothetical protein
VADRTPVEGTWVELPADVASDLRVYVNGDEVHDPADFRRDGGRLLFTRPLVPSRSDSFWERLTMMTAGVGFYGQGDAVDVHYLDASGRPGVSSNLRLQPPTR